MKQISTNTLNTAFQTSDTPAFKSTGATSADDGDWVGGDKWEDPSLGGRVNLAWGDETRNITGEIESRLTVPVYHGFVQIVEKSRAYIPRLFPSIVPSAA